MLPELLRLEIPAGTSKSLTREKNCKHATRHLKTLVYRLGTNERYTLQNAMVPALQPSSG